jgi:hypothetical protein
MTVGIPRRKAGIGAGLAMLAASPALAQLHPTPGQRADDVHDLMSTGLADQPYRSGRDGAKQVQASLNRLSRFGDCVGFRDRAGGLDYLRASTDANAEAHAYWALRVAKRCERDSHVRYAWVNDRARRNGPIVDAMRTRPAR